MRPTIFCLFVLAIAGAGAVAGDAETETANRSPEALEILKKVDAAAKAVDAVRCDVTLVPSGIATNFVSAGKGTALMQGWNDGLPRRFFATVRTKMQQDGEETEITGGGNGDSFFVIDHGQKKGYEDMDPAVMGSYGNLLSGFGMAEFVHPEPFSDELDGEVVELVGDATVNGEDCWEILVKYSGGRGESTWFFAKSDSLPRKRVRRFSQPGMGDGAIEITVSRVDTSPEIPDDLFRMRLPEGYEQVDDFAP